MESEYAAAIAIQKQLAADFPARPDLRVALAHSYTALGSVFANTGRLPEAEIALRAALDLRKQLAADLPARPDLRQHLAATQGNLGCVLEDLGRSKEADEAYSAAHTVNKQLVAEFPKQLDLRNELTSALGNLAFFRLRQRDFQAAKAYLNEAWPHHEAVLKAIPGNPIYRQFYHNNLVALVQTSAGLGDQAGALRAAERLRDLGWDPPGDAYDAACALSLCMPIVQKNEKASQDERAKQAASYGDAAMKMLHAAVARGFKDSAHMQEDKDLESLRERDDFKKLLAEMEPKKP
jgi:tetratricopeptide (TPR) repeat protein